MRAWLRSTVLELVRPPDATPVLIHCLAGRDGTGVAVGTILTLLDIPREIILADFMRSDGVSETAITNARDGLSDPETWIKSETPAALRALFGRT